MVGKLKPFFFFFFWETLYPEHHGVADVNTSFSYLLTSLVCMDRDVGMTC